MILPHNLISQQSSSAFMVTALRPVTIQNEFWDYESLEIL